MEAAVERPPPSRPPSGSRRPDAALHAPLRRPPRPPVDELLGHRRRRRCVALELRSPCPARWARRRSQMWPYWPLPPVCRMYLPSASDRLGDGLAVRHLRLADVGLDLELAQQPVDDDLQVQLAHAGDDASGPSPRRCARGSDGILHRQPLQRRPMILSWSAVVFGSMAMSITGSGNSIRSRMIGCLLVAERVAGGGELQAHHRGRCRRRSTSSISSRLSARICTRRPTRSRLPFAGFQTAVPASQPARVDADERQRPHEAGRS